MSKKSTTEIFIEKANEVHANKYEYSKVKYISNKTPVIIDCKRSRMPIVFKNKKKHDNFIH